jgi:AcrR family transcriptional regulator
VLDVATRDRQAERREATRLEILDAAWTISREKGLADLTLREVGARIGMRAPSLYSYFESKNAIYDAMFEQAWAEYLAVLDQVTPSLPRSARAGLRKIAHTFFDFAVTDLVRHQLMNQRTLPGFVPSRQSYAPAVDVLERTRRYLGRLGVEEGHQFDLFTALVGGLIDAQQANDPNGTRWARLLDEAVDMFADHIGLPRSGKKSP